ncbi:low molecular weight phosphatase family protein [Kordia jejudonensis]|uniref:arsenate reductase n=1 Tax=Kordia jejudonensis TaxID=1348245 RepID=UPI00062914FC|nr:arsenate reductase [Kordia jejudonensis]
MIFQKLLKNIEQLAQHFDEIPSERKEQLAQLSTYIQEKYEAKKMPKLIVICTHNSRRSHLGQLWLAVAADYYKLPTLQSFSGGTEATLFHPNAIAAVERIGFKVAIEAQAKNPIYNIKWQENQEAYQAFSKRFDEAPNPKEAFAAIMVCTEADEGCPFVSGTDFRIALPFEDPKAFDGTAQEAQKYDERCQQIGTEMLYVLSKVSIN